jgi:hypothetical protein
MKRENLGHYVRVGIEVIEPDGYGEVFDSGVDVICDHCFNNGKQNGSTVVIEYWEPMGTDSGECFVCSKNVCGMEKETEDQLKFDKWVREGEINFNKERMIEWETDEDWRNHYGYYNGHAVCTIKVNIHFEEINHLVWNIPIMVNDQTFKNLYDAMNFADAAIEKYLQAESKSE